MTEWCIAKRTFEQPLDTCDSRGLWGLVICSSKSHHSWATSSIRFVFFNNVNDFMIRIGHSRIKFWLHCRVSSTYCPSISLMRYLCGCQSTILLLYLPSVKNGKNSLALTRSGRLSTDINFSDIIPTQCPSKSLATWMPSAVDWQILNLEIRWRWRGEGSFDLKHWMCIRA